MAITFSRTLRSIGSFKFSMTVFSLGVLALLSGAWAIWLFFARVTVIEQTDQARVVIEDGLATLDTRVAGTVDAVLVNLGDTVKQDQVLIRLDGGSQILAPNTGVVADLADIYPGAFLQQGDYVTSILPQGSLSLEADFAPQRAMGRIRTGQVGTLRLDGFPWPRYGSIACKVTRVASHVRDGKLRVELALVGQIPKGIPLQHGLTGQLELELGQMSPLEMITDELGARLSGDTEGATH